MSEKKPWAHVSTRDGKFAGVIAASLDEHGPPPSAAEQRKWKREVAQFCGDAIANGFTITTVYSRAECTALTAGMPIWKKEPKAKAADTLPLFEESA